MYLAQAVGHVALTLDSDTIVLGGGVLQSSPTLYWMLVEALGLLDEELEGRAY